MPDQIPANKNKTLNKEQLQAVEHGTGPLLIIAGAGTGKTTVITERVKHIISQGLASPKEILALTFTEKAAREMEERIDIALPYGYTQMWTLTFHAFCDRILREDGFHIGVDPGFRLITDTEATSLLRRHIFKLDLDYFRPLGNPNKFIAGLLQHFGHLKDEDLSSEEYLTWTKKLEKNGFKDEVEEKEIKKNKELAYLYKSYEEIKMKDSLMDFSDLICATLKLFRERPNVLRTYQNRFKFILVDEFQDTNYAQNQTLNLLAGHSKNITVVADDDQSIYRWRGAAISNVIQFKKTYPDTRLIVLTQNYRSTQEILDRSYRLIQHNNPDRLEIKEGIDKKLKSARNVKGEEISFIHTDRVENEAEAVAKEILLLIENPQRISLASKESLSYRDFAVLVRANAHADSFTQAFARLGIPFQFLGPGQLFHQPEIKDLIAYLRLLTNLDDDACFFRVLSMDFFNIEARNLAAINTFAKRLNLHLFEASEMIANMRLNEASQATPIDLPFLSKETKESLTKIVKVIHKHLELLKRETAGKILFYFLEDTGMLSSIMDYKYPVDEKKATNIMKFFNKLKTFETDHKDATVVDAVEWIDLSMELGESPLASNSDWVENDAVNIITIHSAKGLEFPVVFLVNLVSQRFPSIERSEKIPVPDALVKEILHEGDFHLQEERRLFYVGMTRARDKLYLTAADFYGEGKREKKISPFIFEALGTEITPQFGTASQTQLNLLDWQGRRGAKSEEQVVLPLVKNQVIYPVTYLSYSQIQTFLNCPLHYKARYILNIPSPPTASLSFGNTIHLTLKDFYLQLKSGESRSASMSKLKNSIHDLYKKKWIPFGYEDKRQAELFFQKGEKFLDEFLETQFMPEKVPELLEQPFTIPLIDSQRKISLKIGGKIDRVDSLPDGTIQIIDYKTGANIPTQREADNDLQLSFYALAATSIKEFPYNRSPEQVKLTLYYFDQQKLISTARSSEQLIEAKQKIFEYADEMSHSDFKCSGSVMCQSCEFKMLCDTR